MPELADDTKNPDKSLHDSLIFKFGNLGRIAIEPRYIHRRDLPYVDYLIFPRQIPAKKVTAAHLWVESRECPIFCVRTEIENFQRAGFGLHKFNVVEGFREISVEGGSILFYPAARERHLGIKGLVSDLFEAWGLRQPTSYHLKLKSRNAPPLLILVNPMLEKLDVQILNEEKPAHIIGLAGFADTEWKRVEKHFSQRILLEHEVLNLLKEKPLALSPELPEVQLSI